MWLRIHVETVPHGTSLVCSSVASVAALLLAKSLLLSVAPKKQRVCRHKRAAECVPAAHASNAAAVCSSVVCAAWCGATGSVDIGDPLRSLISSVFAVDHAVDPLVRVMMAWWCEKLQPFS